MWLGWAALAHRVLNNPRREPFTGFAWIVNALYVRLFHGLRVEGREHIPIRPPMGEDGQPAGGVGRNQGLVIIANHTAGVDPQLIQSACWFWIRWVMTSEMRIRAIDGLWTWLEIIFVGGDGERSGASELGAIKEMIRYVKAGGALGIFPEGRLERPKGVLHPFQPGVGMLIARSKAKVLPLVVDGTPRGNTAWVSLWKPSRSRLRVMPMIDYNGWTAEAIVADLQQRYEAWTGWRVVEPVDERAATPRA